MGTFLRGLAVSEGIAICQAVIFIQTVTGEYEKTVASSDIDTEIERYRTAVGMAIDKLNLSQARAKNLGKVQQDIIATHLLMLNDKTLKDKIESLIHTGMSAEYAVDNAIEEFTKLFGTIDDEYIRERSSDIRDVGRRLLMILNEENTVDFLLGEPKIVVADDLMPSDTALLDAQFVKGIVTAKGGKTSHTAILARTMGIPAVVGVGSDFASIQNGDVLIIDGFKGIVYVNPDLTLKGKYQAQLNEFQAYRARLSRLKDLPSETKDGKSIEIAANIGNPEEVSQVMEMNADGVGLFRTEFLFMKKSQIPSEEEQFEVYKTVLQSFPKHKVIIRTLDAGGDKGLSYLHLLPEENPALGFRAIRVCLAQKEVFKTQLRAMLRAGIYGNLHIMFPMIACLEELQQAKRLLQETERELTAAGVPHAKAPRVGIMIEIPAAALMADRLAQEVDFFSIGTNDLVQYTLAADRMNPQVAYLSDYFAPAVLKMIALTCQAAKKADIFVGMCGEMASDTLAQPLLLGLGITELSMNPNSILPSKDTIRKLSYAETIKYAQYALTLPTADDVRQYCRELQSNIC